ncbi:MAG TPA: DUF72 domain-containing protein [Thermoanaerobaculia bacterium]|nr:DUF72 domain-containing protein [Thermoanaerobaculia bacterium]
MAAARAPEELHRLAGELPAGLHLGTSSWSFPGWRGIVWEGAESQTRLARHGLPAYAQHPLLNGVGIDRSYYQPLATEEYAAYAAQVPAGFRFVVKAHEAVTVSAWPDHDRYGGRRGEPNPRFLDAAYAAGEVVQPFAEGLGDKGGALVFQFAPQDLGIPARFVDRLHAFLAALPRGPLYAVELRNREVLSAAHAAAYAAALADVGAIHCANRHPRMPEVAVQAERTGAAAAPAFLCRWMLRPGLTYEGARQRYHPFDRLVDDDLPTRRALAEIALATTARGRPVYVLANNKAEGSSPLTLFRLAERVARLRREGHPLAGPGPGPG